MSNHSRDFECITVDKFLNAMLRTFIRVQRVLDKRSMDLAEEFREFAGTGFSTVDDRMVEGPQRLDDIANPYILPLLSMVRFCVYRVSELNVEFSVGAEDHCKEMAEGIPSSLSDSSGHSEERTLAVRIDIARKEEFLIAELRCNDEVVKTIFLRFPLQYSENPAHSA